MLYEDKIKLKDRDGNVINPAIKENQGGILAGKSRTGLVDVARDAEGFITKIEITEGGVKRTLDVTRDVDNRIVKIIETIT